MKKETNKKYTVVMRVLNCGRNSENRKGTREMLEMNITEVDSTSPGYQLDV